MTFSRISRSLLHILLNIRSQDLDMYEKSGNCLYARVLGFRKSSAELFSILKTSSHVPILTKLTHTDSLSSIGIHMIEHDIFCSNLYESIISDKKPWFTHRKPRFDLYIIYI